MSDLHHLNECEQALVAVREIIFEHCTDEFQDKWLGACVGSPSEIPAALKELLEARAGGVTDV